ncbi:hypothetical protein A3K63_04600 [Candidatus Micrarchaeota archaeon RBG_16_49_10]|nr:MAG: hypothetical protein A3K63_04600 [Candidatus Micrarchaeota archaeon RBG_16_49_10]
MPELEFYVRKKISEIDPAADSKVKAIGLVLERDEDTMVIDDGTGKLRVFGNLPADLKADGMVRVFGLILPGDAGFEMKADIVQDLADLDINLYKAIDELVIGKGV